METKLAKLPSLPIMEALKLNFANITNFHGRSRRSELWWNYLVYTILTTCVSLLLGSSFMLVGIIIGFLMQLCIMAVTIRRMHDGGHSGLWVVAAVVIGLATNIYGLVCGFDHLADLSPEEMMALVFSPVFLVLYTLSLVVNVTIFVFAVMDGDKTDNKYGSSTKYIQESADED